MHAPEPLLSCSLARSFLRLPRGDPPPRSLFPSRLGNVQPGLTYPEPKVPVQGPRAEELCYVGVADGNGGCPGIGATLRA